jgi:hypothetical protein
MTAWWALRAATTPWCLAATEPGGEPSTGTEAPADRETVVEVTASGRCGAGAALGVPRWPAACTLAATPAWISGLESAGSHVAAIQFWTCARDAPWGSMPRALAELRSSSRLWPLAQARNCVVSSPAFQSDWSW